jgi:hypothetical protein
VTDVVRELERVPAAALAAGDLAAGVGNLDQQDPARAQRGPDRGESLGRRRQVLQDVECADAIEGLLGELDVLESGRLDVEPKGFAGVRSHLLVQLHARALVAPPARFIEEEPRGPADFEQAGWRRQVPRKQIEAATRLEPPRPLAGAVVLPVVVGEVGLPVQARVGRPRQEREVTGPAAQQGRGREDGVWNGSGSADWAAQCSGDGTVRQR